jgi:ankyrin repeat protein
MSDFINSIINNDINDINNRINNLKLLYYNFNIVKNPKIPFSYINFENYYRYSILMIAIDNAFKKCDFTILKLLLDFSLDVKIKFNLNYISPDNSSALSMILKNNYIQQEIIDLLFDYINKFKSFDNIDNMINFKDKNDDTPLLLAINENNCDIRNLSKVKRIIDIFDSERKYDLIDVINKKQYTPIMLATKTIRNHYCNILNSYEQNKETRNNFVLFKYLLEIYHDISESGYKWKYSLEYINSHNESVLSILKNIQKYKDDEIINYFLIYINYPEINGIPTDIYKNLLNLTYLY